VTTTHHQSHTEAEILRQPALWPELARTVAERRTELDALLGPLLREPSSRILLCGAGTSAYAGQVAASALSTALGRRLEALATTDLVAAPQEHLVPDVPTLMVSFARSGNSPESLAATELADQLLGEVRHLVLTCDPEGRLAQAHRDRDSSVVLLMPDGANDQGFAMTSSFTCMTLAALLALGGPDAQATGRVEQLSQAAASLLADREQVAELAALRPERVVYLGSGAFTGLARESALKLTELTAGEVVTLAESSLGFRHGPKSVLTSRTLTVVYLSSHPYTRRYDLDLLAELAAGQDPGPVLAVDGSGRTDVPEAVPTIRLRGVTDLPDAWWALPAVLVAQLLGLESSLLGGHTPDNPFPTGEVNRVVQGVTIHPWSNDAP
jgi:tagatose-6-phosphate ketose/aldose isomerase